MTAVADAWLRESLELLARFQFTEEAAALLRAAPIGLVARANLADARGPRIVIPTDLPAPARPAPGWRVPFGATQLHLWNRVECPGDGWAAVPSTDAPLWWRHTSGTLVPAWNLWANVRDLLSFREEREIGARDSHGRFPAEVSPRHAIGALAVPAANDANAALLDAAVALARGDRPALRIPPAMVQPPGLVLSHDCDQLRGNDLITQGVRAYRAGAELVTGNVAQSARHLWAIAENLIDSRAYFSGNMHGMIDLERQFGFTSVSYFLTGQGGRFGARSGDAIAREVAATIPSGWEVGVHYNYWTVGSDERLRKEMDTVASAAGRAVIAGRAHYLRFDPLESPAFLERNGIRFDESVGWASSLAYRAGIAGPFFPFDQTLGRGVRVLEMPMTCMDSALLAARATGDFERLWDHLAVVGGVLSVLIHPGAFYNPEHPAYTGLYDAILARAYAAGARSWTPEQMLARVDAWMPAREQPSAT